MQAFLRFGLVLFCKFWVWAFCRFCVQANWQTAHKANCKNSRQAFCQFAKAQNAAIIAGFWPAIFQWNLPACQSNLQGVTVVCNVISPPAIILCLVFAKNNGTLHLIHPAFPLFNVVLPVVYVFGLHFTCVCL